MPKLICSIAEKPGTFGLRFHNEGYRELGLDYAYIPLKVRPNQLEAMVELVRDNFHGCSVSKPHKVEVMKFLDGLDESAARSSVNTILNENGKLKGYNTDYHGARSAISLACDIRGKDVVMLGAGGVGRAIAYAVKDLGANLTIVNRDQRKGRNLAEETLSNVGEFAMLDKYGADLFINATNIGMGDEKSPLAKNSIANYKAIMDVVVGKTMLLEDALSMAKTIIPGVLMTAYQAERQFEIYTGRKLPPSFIEKYARST